MLILLSVLLSDVFRYDVGKLNENVAPIPSTLKKRTVVRGSCIRYTVPKQSIIKIGLTRNADVRLYGTTENSRGIAITSDDKILIRPSRRTAKIIRLDYDRTTR